MQMDPKCYHKCSYKTEPKEVTQTQGRETYVELRAERHSHKPRNVNGCPELEEAMEGFFTLEPPQAVLLCPHLDSRHPASRTVRAHSYVVLSPSLGGGKGMQEG